MRIGIKSVKEWCNTQFRLLMGYEQYPDRLDEVPRGCIKTEKVDEQDAVEGEHGWWVSSIPNPTMAPSGFTVHRGTPIEPIQICDYQGCNNEATLWDDYSNKVCKGCMDREVESGAATYDEYTSI